MTMNSSYVDTLFQIAEYLEIEDCKNLFLINKKMYSYFTRVPRFQALWGRACVRLYISSEYQSKL